MPCGRDTYAQLNFAAIANPRSPHPLIPGYPSRPVTGRASAWFGWGFSPGGRAAPVR